jgi:hypothetical protein
MKLYSIIKLSNGEEIYARIPEDVNEGAPILLVEDPLVEEEYFNEDGSTSTALVKFCRKSHERRVPIIKSHILALTAMSSPFKSYYKAAVEFNLLAEKSYDDKITDTASRIYFKLQVIETAGKEPLSFTLDATDTYH